MNRVQTRLRDMFNHWGVPRRPYTKGWVQELVDADTVLRPFSQGVQDSSAQHRLAVLLLHKSPEAVESTKLRKAIVQGIEERETCARRKKRMLADLALFPAPGFTALALVRGFKDSCQKTSAVYDERDRRWLFDRPELEALAPTPASPPPPRVDFDQQLQYLEEIFDSKA